MNDDPASPERHKKKPHSREIAALLLMQREPAAPPVTTAARYRIANYVDGLVGASPECEVLLPEFDSGLEFGDDDDQPGDWLMDGGVLGGIPWDGTFYRDTTRYPAGGELFWSSYLKPGSAPGMKAGYWINFGVGWSHLHNDNPAEILTGASQKLFHDTATGNWMLVIQATKFVTHEVINVWTGTKAGGNDPTGTYSRESGLDPVAALTVEAAP